ncbi:MAG TPA: hypothetical protein VGH63_13995 [Polyangia bacterium]
MSSPKVKGPAPPGPMSVTGMYVPWRLSTAEAGESVRWQCVDGRWVAISLGQGGEAGKTIVTSSEGQRQAVDDYESALKLAKSWRV